jgi:hypothetical protein
MQHAGMLGWGVGTGVLGGLNGCVASLPLTHHASFAAAHLSCRLSKSIMRSTTVAAAAFALLLLASSAAAGRQLKDTAGRQLLGITPAVDLKTAGDYVILSKAGVTNVATSAITGDIGASPIALEAVTGFSLVADASNKFSKSTEVTGSIYASTHVSPTPSLLTTAISDFETAYTDAAGRVIADAANVNLAAGILNGVTLTTGVYKWSTGVLVTGDIYISGTSSDIFIFQISETLTVNANVNVILADDGTNNGPPLAENIFWQVAETVVFKAGAHFEGIILAATDVTFVTESSLNGRIFSQTAVALQMATITQP